MCSSGNNLNFRAFHACVPAMTDSTCPASEGFSCITHKTVANSSIPCGFSDERLPIGLQIMANSFQEATMFRVAAAYERATPWHTLRPDLPVEAVA